MSKRRFSYERHKKEVEVVQNQCKHTKTTKWINEYQTEIIDCDWCGKTLKRKEFGGLMWHKANIT
jgi:hypothetical protein